MIIVDYCKDFDERLWNKAIDKISKSDDPLKENYLTLTPQDFVCLPVLIKDDEIICFSGLQLNKTRWTEHFARINARMWIAPEWRHRGPGKMTKASKYLNTQYLLPVQLEYARSINLQGVFISREGNYRRFLQQYCELIKVNAGVEFTVLDGMYNVCGCLDPVPESCKQLIALHTFRGDVESWNTAMAQHKLTVENVV
jgi:hypothetical protein